MQACVEGARMVEGSLCEPWGQKAAKSPALLSRWAPGSLLIHKTFALSGFLVFISLFVYYQLMYLFTHEVCSYNKPYNICLITRYPSDYLFMRSLFLHPSLHSRIVVYPLNI